MSGASGRVETARILRLGELERARGQSRRSGRAKRLRQARVGTTWIVLGLALFGLFAVSVKWLISFFERGVVAH